MIKFKTPKEVVKMIEADRYKKLQLLATYFMPTYLEELINNNSKYAEISYSALNSFINAYTTPAMRTFYSNNLGSIIIASLSMNEWWVRDHTNLRLYRIYRECPDGRLDNYSVVNNEDVVSAPTLRIYANDVVRNLRDSINVNAPPIEDPPF